MQGTSNEYVPNAKKHVSMILYFNSEPSSNPIVFRMPNPQHMCFRQLARNRPPRCPFGLRICENSEPFERNPSMRASTSEVAVLRPKKAKTMFSVLSKPRNWAPRASQRPKTPDSAPNFRAGAESEAENAPEGRNTYVILMLNIHKLPNARNCLIVEWGVYTGSFVS